MSDFPKQDISIALIRRMADQGWRWLARWDAKQECFDFVTAARLENESAREAIGREVSWVLNLARTRDILVCNMAQCNLEFLECLPGDAFQTHMKAAFYNVELYGQDALRHVQSNPENVWLSSQEVCNGRTNDNLEISKTLTFLVAKSGVIQHWESST